MDAAQPITSPTPKTSGPIFPNIFRFAGIGSIIGIILAVAAMRLPYNRIVVYHQQTSQSVKIESVRIWPEQGGFVVIYILGPKGSSIAGVSDYLRSGYYTNLIITIDPLLLADENRQFMARIYADNGNGTFDEREEWPTEDIYGKQYSKHFWMLFDGRWAWHHIVDFAYNPVGILADRLFP